MLERTTLKKIVKEEQEQKTAAHLERLRVALEEIGLEPLPPTPANEIFTMGHGTSMDVHVPGVAKLSVSTLGPFVVDQGDENEAPPDVRAAAERAGLKWLDEVGQRKFAGLSLNHYDQPGALTVCQLLFYWAD